jgi:hypothetical protein
MKPETKKNIKKYAKLRGHDNLGINPDTLWTAYVRASDEMKEKYDREMETYFDAIKDKSIKKGQSILHVYDSAPERDLTNS